MNFPDLGRTDLLYQKEKALNIKNGELFVERYWRVWLKLNDADKISFSKVGERFAGEPSATHPYED